MTLRERARAAFNTRRCSEWDARKPVIARLIRDAVKAAGKVGIESSAEDWRDFNNVEPDTVYAELDRIEFIYRSAEGVLCRVRRDVGYEAVKSLADIGDLMFWQNQ